MRPLACNWYYCAQFVAKPRAACALLGDVEKPRLMTLSVKPEVHNITTPPEEDRATAIGNMHKKLGEHRTCSSEDMIVDKHTHRQTDTLITILRCFIGVRSNND